MRPVHAFTSATHFVDHVAPVWKALDPAERGTWWVPTRRLALYASDEHGLDTTINRTLPSLSVTARGGVQPHVLVASTGDMRQCGDRRRVVLIEHGAGQTYRGAGGEPARSHGYPGGTDRQRVDLFLCPNRTVAELNLARYPNTPAAVVGSPHLDRLALLRAGYTGQLATGVTFHWDCDLCPETRSAWPHYRRWFERGPNPGVLGHSHPRMAPTLSRWWPRQGVPYVSTLAGLFPRIGVLVADNTSALFEAAAAGVPVVVLNAPWYRRDVDHGLRFWTWSDIGPQVDHPDELPDAIADAYHPRWRLRRGAMTEAVYGRPPDGSAAAASVAVMRAHLP